MTFYTTDYSMNTCVIVLMSINRLLPLLKAEYNQLGKKKAA